MELFGCSFSIDDPTASQPQAAKKIQNKKKEKSQTSRGCSPERNSHCTIYPAVTKKGTHKVGSQVFKDGCCIFSDPSSVVRFATDVWQLQSQCQPLVHPLGKGRANGVESTSGELLKTTRVVIFFGKTFHHSSGILCRAYLLHECLSRESIWFAGSKCLCLLLFTSGPTPRLTKVSRTAQTSREACNFSTIIISNAHGPGRSSQLLSPPTKAQFQPFHSIHCVLG